MTALFARSTVPVLLGITLLCGCGQKATITEASEPTTQPAGVDRTFGLRAAGRTVHVHAGREVLIRLPACIATGDVWEVVQYTQPVLELHSTEFIPDTPDGTDGMGRFSFIFDVTQTGSASIVIKKTAGYKPAMTYTLNLACE